ncbi:MAG: hypothetical protein NTX22_10590 [Ignavibacteriales bacterium]|nr:hypothetical protein [Ignavibacteriales bacterium]
MKTTNKSFSVLTVLLMFALITMANNSVSAKSFGDTTKTKKMEMKHGMHHHMGMKMDMKGNKMTDTTGIIHEGVIDLKVIDANKDGKVFQDQMHWNVISDKAGKCPLCKMTLKEVTLKEAKTNLKKNDFKVKQ